MTMTEHGLICPGADDYAAVALFLQHDALAVESALDTISDSFDEFRLRPTLIAATTATFGPVASSGEAVQLLNPWAVTYSNFLPVPATTATSGIRITIPRDGRYNYGGFINAVAAGAVTANSRRTIFVSATLNTTGSTTLLSQITWRTVDTNTAGEFLVASGGSFYATAGSLVDVQVNWSHANAASNVSVLAGAKLWCHYAGSGVEVGSA